MLHITNSDMAVWLVQGGEVLMLTVLGRLWGWDPDAGRLSPLP
ncbi:hypothetical protein [Gallaecimonas sp. GXIMD4217]